MADGIQSDPRVQFAAERTFLAWIRTGLSFMGFGFVVARFGLFLQALRVGQPDLLPRTLSLSPWFGMALVMGVLLAGYGCPLALH